VTTILNRIRLRFLLLAAAIAFVVAIRSHFIDIAFERDEGEYAYAGQLLLQGIPPYQYAYNMKLPGTYLGYAGIMAVFGESIRGVHLGLLLITVASMMSIFLLGDKLFGPHGGWPAAATYGLLSVSWSVLGPCGHATHFVVLFALAGAVLLYRGGERDSTLLFLFSGLLFGFAFLMKQPGLFFAMFGFCWAAVTEISRQRRQGLIRCGMLAAGIVLPFALTCLWLLLAGVFGRFRFWTFGYVREYQAEMELDEVWNWFASSLTEVAEPNLPLWGISIGGMVAMYLIPGRRRQAVFATGFTLAGLLAVVPGFHFRAHYFVTLLPGIALGVGGAIAALHHLVVRCTGRERLATLLSVCAFAIYFIWSVSNHWGLLIGRPAQEVADEIYTNQGFSDFPEVGRYVEENSGPDDRVFVFGSEPQVYFHARRRSATGYIYLYPLLEEQSFAKRMQEEMIAEVEAARPLFFVDAYQTWSEERNLRAKDIRDWASGYVTANYKLVALFVWKDGRKNWYYDEQATRFKPDRGFILRIYRRNQP